MGIRHSMVKKSIGMIGMIILVIVLSLAMTTSSGATAGEGHTWAHGDWSSRVAWEAHYALSQAANGFSNFQTTNDSYGQRWYGDWNYVASDSYARDKAKLEASDIGNLDDYVLNGSTYHRGGWCTFFVRLVLYRATYWAFSDHLTTPNYPSSVYSWADNNHMTQNYGSVQPGWVFSSPSSQHMAIADSRATVNGQVGWWLIDANYVNPSGGSYTIGKHFMPDTVLLSGGYWGWLPNWGSNN